jgi:riboflavin kinase/FMN adenylyltransferase
VYAAKIDINGKKTTGALYFGDCPTYTGREVHFEFHALEFCDREPAVGEAANLWLHRFIRPDVAFSDEKALAGQIKTDINVIKKYFSQEM